MERKDNENLSLDSGYQVRGLNEDEFGKRPSVVNLPMLVKYEKRPPTIFANQICQQDLPLSKASTDNHGKAYMGF